MIVIAWAATMLGLLTAWVLSWTPNGPASLALLVFLFAFIVIACWGFGAFRSGVQR